MKILSWIGVFCVVLAATAVVGSDVNPGWEFVKANGYEAVGRVCIFGLLWGFVAAAAVKQGGMKASDPLDVPLLHWSKTDPFTVRDLLNGGVAVFGRSGSGKTSGSGRRLLRAIVRLARSGGLILAAKPEDADDVRELFDRAKRTDDLLVINPDGELRCNFIDYIRKMGGDTRDITKAITTIAECLNSSDSNGNEDGKYWEAQQERMIYNAVECVKLGTGNVTAPDLMRFISGAACDPNECNSEQWEGGFHNRTMRAAYAAGKAAATQHDLELALSYWLDELPRMSSRTRSSIEAGVMQTLHVFNTGLVRELCSTTTNISPDDALSGRWILVNLPPSKYGDSGKFVNAGWKYLMQKAVLRRKAGPNGSINVIWADEAHQWINSHDSHYLAQCRSHLGCQVILTQSLHSIFGAMSGQAGQQRGLGLLTNFSTKIFHAMGSPEDAKFASSLIGEAEQQLVNTSSPPNPDVFSAVMGLSQMTSSMNTSILPIIQPRMFLNGMRCGGKASKYLVDGIVVKSGEPFSDGANYKVVTFDQRG